MPNAFAYIMLFSWPLVAVVLFRTLSLQKALIWTLLGGYLILPSATGIKLPMVPNLDKSLIPAVSALILCLIYAPKAQPAPDSAGKTGRVLIIGLFTLLIGAPFLTVLQNPEPVVIGPIFLPGLRIYDAFSMISAIVISIMPFWIGLRYLNTRDGHKALLQAFVFGALAYSLPALFEVRMSPQLHTWVYGFFPHDFIQHIRAGGFRPVVFLNHGLSLGTFLCVAVLSALVLWREALRERKTASGWLFAAIWLVIVLVVSKNLGALAITVVLATLAIFTGRRTQTSFAIVVATAVILFPMLRGAGFIPVDAIYEAAASVDAERAESLKYRFDNEDILLARANEKPVFGWGTWGRNQLFDEFSGQMVSVTDGIWIILIGTYGWLGYVAHFGLLTLPILFYVLRRNQFGPSLITPGLMLVLCANLIDLIPNAGLFNYVWLMAGGLMGYVLWRPANASEDQVQTPAQATTWVGATASAEPASWVMAGNGITRRRKRTARQRASE